MAKLKTRSRRQMIPRCLQSAQTTAAAAAAAVVAQRQDEHEANPRPEDIARSAR